MSCAVWRHAWQSAGGAKRLRCAAACCSPCGCWLALCGTVRCAVSPCSASASLPHPRRAPLGLDRHFRRYWWGVAGQLAAVLVEQGEGGEGQEGGWRMLSSAAELEALLASLDGRGTRELVRSRGWAGAAAVAWCCCLVLLCCAAAWCCRLVLLPGARGCCFCWCALCVCCMTASACLQPGCPCGCSRGCGRRSDFAAPEPFWSWFLVSLPLTLCLLFLLAQELKRGLEKALPLFTAALKKAASGKEAAAGGRRRRH